MRALKLFDPKLKPGEFERTRAAQEHFGTTFEHVFKRTDANLGDFMTGLREVGENLDAQMQYVLGEEAGLREVIGGVNEGYQPTMKALDEDIAFLKMAIANGGLDRWLDRSLEGLMGRAPEDSSASQHFWGIVDMWRKVSPWVYPNDLRSLREIRRWTISVVKYGVLNGVYGCNGDSAEEWGRNALAIKSTRGYAQAGRQAVEAFFPSGDLNSTRHLYSVRKTENFTLHAYFLEQVDPDALEFSTHSAEDDCLVEDVITYIREHPDQISTVVLGGVFGTTHLRISRILDLLEKRGILSPRPACQNQQRSLLS